MATASKYPGSPTYSEFCSGYKTKGSEELFGEQSFEQFKDVPLDTNKEYAVVFVYAKGENEIKELVGYFFGTSASHLGMYVGGGLFVLGAGLIATGVAAEIGVPVVMISNSVMVGGLNIFGWSAIANYFTNNKLTMEWMSFFLIVEFDEKELSGIPCEYLPAEQF